MKHNAPSPKEKQSRSNVPLQKQHKEKSKSSFFDNRPEAIKQRNLEKLVTNSPQVQKSIQLQQKVISTPTLLNRPISGGLVAQCVGGAKYGLEKTGDEKDAEVKKGIQLLKAGQQAYKTRVKAEKAKAAADFKGGDQGDFTRQKDYTDKLRAAERTPAGLLAELGTDFTFDAAGTIFYKGKEIAKLHQGVLAYVQHVAPAGAGFSAIYKRHTLDGPSTKDYVQINGAFIRRFAHRGITPPERAAYKAGNALNPINAANRATGQVGYNFDKKTGGLLPRPHAPDHPNDLEWINSSARTNLPALPANPQLRAFLQTRKGVGKEFSATSTAKEISSNSGGDFMQHGHIDIDLAQVPTANVLHHYTQAPFTTHGIAGTIGRRLGDRHHLDEQVERANESVARNRELIISSIPHAAVTGLHDSGSRKAYEKEYKKLYDPKFEEAYKAELADSGYPFAPSPVPTPQSYPWPEDHFSEMQAKRDFTPHLAEARGKAAARPRIEFAAAYEKEYKRAWGQGFEDAAYGLSPFIQQDPSGYVETPESPSPTVIPVGVTAANGTTTGQNDGDRDGRVEGAAYTG